MGVSQLKSLNPESRVVSVTFGAHLVSMRASTVFATGKGSSPGMTTSHATRPSGPETSSCPFCHGSGRCAKCGGTGERLVKKGRLRVKRTVECVACRGTGECDLCHGHGVVTNASDSL